MTKFKIGDVVECIESISENNGGPLKGQKFVVLSTSISKDRKGLYWLGFKLPNYTQNYYDNLQKVREGKVTNWCSSCFKVIGYSKVGLLLYEDKV